MIVPRIIARLDIKGENLVKGVQLEGLRVLGKPEEFAAQYNEDGIDELLYVDVVASLYERNSLTEVIRRTATHAFVPLTVGGGIRTLNDIANALHAGADKVAINTAALRKPTFITDAAQRFGSQAIAVVIEAQRCRAYMNNGREKTGRNVFEWALEIEQRGAGEIIVTSIAHEGTGRGFDLELVRGIARKANVPVVAHGGAGCLQHIYEVLQIADGVCLASMLHYHTTTVSAIKEYLSDNGVKCRI